MTTINIDWQIAPARSVQLIDDANVFFLNGVAGQKYFLLVRYSGDYEITWPFNVIWKNNNTEPTQAQTNQKVDVFTFIYDGTCYHGAAFGLNYSQFVI
jgi:hypothetical protein